MAGDVEPFMRAAAIGEVAAQRLAAVEAVAVDAAIGISGSGSVTIISARAEAIGTSMPSMAGEPAGLRAGGDDEMVAADQRRARSRRRSTLPPAVRKPATGVCCRMRPPWSCIAQA